MFQKHLKLDLDHILNEEDDELIGKPFCFRLSFSICLIFLTELGCVISGVYRYESEYCIFYRGHSQ